MSLASLSRVSMLGAVVALVGCVPYQTYNQAKRELDKAREANADLSKKYNEAMMKLLALEKGGGGSDGAIRAELARLQRENDDLRNRAALQPSYTKEEIKGLGLEEEEGGLYIKEDLLFAEGSATLKPSALPVLDGIIALHRSKYPDDMIILEGHTDNQPLLRTKELWRFNMRLGYERAHAVFEHFIKNGIKENHMVLRTYSFNKPTDPMSINTKEGRAKNRRVVVRRGGTQI